MIKYYVKLGGDIMQVVKNHNSEYPIGILWNREINMHRK